MATVYFIFKKCELENSEFIFDGFFVELCVNKKQFGETETARPSTKNENRRFGSFDVKQPDILFVVSLSNFIIIILSIVRSHYPPKEKWGNKEKEK